MPVPSITLPPFQLSLLLALLSNGEWTSCPCPEKRTIYPGLLKMVAVSICKLPNRCVMVGEMVISPVRSATVPRALPKRWNFLPGSKFSRRSKSCTTGSFLKSAARAGCPKAAAVTAQAARRFVSLRSGFTVYSPSRRRMTSSLTSRFWALPCLKSGRFWAVVSP